MGTPRHRLAARNLEHRALHANRGRDNGKALGANTMR